MTRDEYLHVLGTEPATDAQVGAIVGAFERLGVVDRAERLAISAELLGLENLGSTKHLVMGDAGRLYRMLLDVRDRAELPGAAVAADDDDQADDGETAGDDDQARERITWPEAIMRVAVAIYAACHGNVIAGNSDSASAEENTSDDRN